MLLDFAVSFSIFVDYKVLVDQFPYDVFPKSEVQVMAFEINLYYVSDAVRI